ncbi:hypothetical protein BD311DRAFT_425908 [Dichomitus squalens]|uniref:Uncharacterized protein n=1 Tax=Dichomitus squalens TaxID=114155 RepID=A0A4Q9MGZ4_9APHY|nr:hypothetical protein BD311DRAFT_425908 [Dichomitus squalens]
MSRAALSNLLDRWWSGPVEPHCQPFPASRHCSRLIADTHQATRVFFLCLAGSSRSIQCCYKARRSKTVRTRGRSLPLSEHCTCFPVVTISMPCMSHNFPSQTVCQNCGSKRQGGVWPLYPEPRSIARNQREGISVPVIESLIS